MKLAWLAAVAVVVSSGVALADTPPSVWDRAADPAVGERYALHLRVQELLEPPESVPLVIRRKLLEMARGQLEAASAATSPDVRLRFDLGEVYHGLDREQDAVDVLKPALAIAPRDTASAGAWEALAFASARLDRSEDEIAAYDAYLGLTSRYRLPLTILANRAEAEMRLGHLGAAIDGYRDVLERGSHLYAVEYKILVLARWGLAVALDRNGETAEAEHEASVAAEEDPVESIIGDRQDVFFVPAYERDWYFALGRTARGRRETEPHRALGWLRSAASTWADYVRQASPDDRWLRLARLHLAVAEQDEKAAEQRVPVAERGGGLFPPHRLRR